jgi:Cof subfamily protein (haloacid dehalogenase superfamily)
LSSLPYRALALDMDGTLLDPQGRISPAATRILRNLSGRGVKIAIASGRMTARITPFVDDLGIPASVIAYNGAEVWEKTGGAWQVVHARTISDRTRDEVFSLCRSRGIFLNIYSGGKLHGYHVDGDFSGSSHYENHTQAVYAGKWRRLEDLPQADIAKLLIVESPEKRDRLFEELAVPYAAHCRVLKSNPEYLEFVDGETSKGSALRFWMKSCGLESHDLLAFGDAENDLEMLTLARRGIAMANSTAGLRALYGPISAWTHEDDGVARALASLFQVEYPSSN